jgi:hypothetical protein
VGIFDSIANSMFGSDDDNKSPLKDIENASDQTPDELALVSHIREYIDNCRQSSARIAQEGICFTNTAYLLGYDGIIYDTNSRQFKNIDPKSEKSLAIALKLTESCQPFKIGLARLCQTPPKFDVRPNSNSSEDKDCARLGIQIIR